MAKEFLRTQNYNKITSKDKNYEFLDPFYKSKIYYKQRYYPNVLQAYLSSKTKSEYFKNKLTIE